MTTPGRKPLPPIDNRLPELVPNAGALMLADVNAVNDIEKEAALLATQLGYEGHLTIGTLEDEIRFFQQRTVEALLETGKRLLILQKLTPHGAFLQRLETLGFAQRTAYRFMAAAQKTSKFAKLASLSGQVKNSSAFLELITHDDDVIENLAEMDDFDRMSASQLRAAARNIRTVKDRLESVNQELHAEVISLKLDKKIVALTDWPDALIPVTDQIAMAGRKLAQAVSELETCRITIFTKAQDLEDDDRASLEAALAHVAEVYEEALNRAERSLARERLTFDKTLGALAPDA